MFVRLKRKPGFTIVELITTIAVFAILSSIAIPAISSWLPDYRIKSAARNIASHVQLARMKAISTNRNYGINFDVSNHSYQMYRNDPVSGWTPGGSAKYLSSHNDVFFNEVTFSHNTLPDDIMVFRPDGCLDNSVSGGVYLINTRGTKCKITVVQATGGVRLYDSW